MLNQPTVCARSVGIRDMADFSASPGLATQYQVIQPQHRVARTLRITPLLGALYSIVLVITRHSSACLVVAV